ncbi:hypothetical protein ABEX47_16870 [Paenibacillus ehimensis]|uniref:hypothetical protein n=1 Tax=Paenibacillus ehimensis TaxID=79264 RepID=UPI003D27F873
MKRIKFYSANDLTYGYYLRKSEELIHEYAAGKEVKGINDLIELYNVKKYFDNKIYPSDWTPENIQYYESIVGKYVGVIGKRFSRVSEDDLRVLYDEVDRQYKNDFWELIEKFKVYEKISTSKFQEFINTSKIYIHEILMHQKLTEHFGQAVREYLICHSSLSAELLLQQYEIKHLSAQKALYFPKALNSKDKEGIISDYVDSTNPNPNYLQLIANIQSNKDKLEISPKILLKAKRRAEEQQKEIFKESTGFQIETSVGFSKVQEEVAILNSSDFSISIIYSTTWIRENTDCATLLNNFIYLFGFTDMQMRCTFVNKFNRMGVFERFLITNSRNAYITGIEFEQKQILSSLQMVGYYRELFGQGIRLEEVIEWFFKEYLSIEFEACNFRVTLPSIHSTYLEKCTHIMPAMESVLKQFILFVQEGQIDFELLDIRSEHLIYKNIPSLVEKKYVYGVGNEFNTATYLLFSDQSGLGYNENIEESYNHYFELLCNAKLKITEYSDHDLSSINWLIEQGYLLLDEEGYVVSRNNSLLLIMHDLYFNEVISYWNCSKSERMILDELEKRNIIEFEDSLFSRPEQDYINYYLNRSRFNNGLDLRNKYSHTQPVYSNDDNTHESNYMIFLRLFIIAVIKINDDFCAASRSMKERS